MHRSFFQLTGLALPHTVVDIGAAETLQEPRYAPLLATEAGRLIGFEPDKQQYAFLTAKQKPRTTFVPVAVGDGKRHTLNICSEPGLTSLMEPNQKVLGLFHEFPAWGVIKERIELDTVRLDDVPETAGVTFLQMDIQGAELMVLQNAIERLKTACVLHIEVEFLQLYKDQPLFSDIDVFLRRQGFILHHFAPLTTRPIAPLVIDNNPRRGLNQVVWADAVFVRDFSDFVNYTDAQLLTTAGILHDCYRSVDLAWRLLIEHNQRTQKNVANTYFGTLTGQVAPATAAA